MLDSSGAKKTPKIQPLSSDIDRDTSLQHNCQNAQRIQTENKCVFQLCDLWMWSPKKRSFHIWWLSLWFTQSAVGPIVMSTFQSCLSSETLLKKKNLINDSFVTLALRRNTWHCQGGQLLFLGQISSPPLASFPRSLGQKLSEVLGQQYPIIWWILFLYQCYNQPQTPALP